MGKISSAILTEDSLVGGNTVKLSGGADVWSQVAVTVTFIP